MARVVRAHEERRLEIIRAAEWLFHEVGYSKCSVAMFILAIGVAKGTFYYYFQLKQEILEAIVDRTLTQIVEMAERAADYPSLNAPEIFQALLANSNVGEDDAGEVSGMLHLPENRGLHEISNVQSVLRLSPIFVRIVEQENTKSEFSVERPLETTQFVFVGIQFLLDGGLFQFFDKEARMRREEAQSIIEKAL